MYKRKYWTPPTLKQTHLAPLNGIWTNNWDIFILPFSIIFGGGESVIMYGVIWLDFMAHSANTGEGID